jgi:hypothetical protein
MSTHSTVVGSLTVTNPSNKSNLSSSSFGTIYASGAVSFSFVNNVIVFPFHGVIAHALIDCRLQFFVFGPYYSLPY